MSDERIYGWAKMAWGRVLEVGYGRGFLTARLLARSAVKQVISFERDLAETTKIPDVGDRHILLEADFMDPEFSAETLGGRFDVVMLDILPEDRTTELLVKAADLVRDSGVMMLRSEHTR